MILQETAHHLFCKLFRIKVIQVCYFRFGSPPGFVLTEQAGNSRDQAIAAGLPLLSNSIVGAIIGFAAVVRIGWELSNAYDVFLAWLGISIATHAFPAMSDAQRIWRLAHSSKAPGWTKVIAISAAGFIYVGAAASKSGFNLIWGIFTAGLVPILIVKLTF